MWHKDHIAISLFQSIQKSTFSPIVISPQLTPPSTKGPQYKIHAVVLPVPMHITHLTTPIQPTLSKIDAKQTETSNYSQHAIRVINHGKVTKALLAFTLLKPQKNKIL